MSTEVSSSDQGGVGICVPCGDNKSMKFWAPFALNACVVRRQQRQRVPSGRLDRTECLGIVWEWYSDWYDGDWYGNSPLADPSGPTEGLHRVVQVRAE